MFPSSHRQILVSSLRRSISLSGFSSTASVASASAAISLIPETLQEMENDSLKSFTNRPSLDERKQRRRSLEQLQIPSFKEYLEQHNLPVVRDRLKILQMNITRYCNQACQHCHVESSPKRIEFMSTETFQDCLKMIERQSRLSSDEGDRDSERDRDRDSERDDGRITTVDITGGAPELHPYFRQFIEQLRSSPHISSDLEIIVRCNLTVLLEPNQEDLHHFYAQNRIRVIASLPCYSMKNVNQQRGPNVFQRSILALQRLNSVGYGVAVDSPLASASSPSSPSLSSSASHANALKLDLVYNPSGAFLPPSQPTLEKQYKEILQTEHGIVFNSLLTLTNMPIKRFADQLYQANKLDDYMSLLVNQFNPHTTKSVMCRDTVSVDWNGWLYDCDFNQQLDLRMGQPVTVHSTVSSTESSPMKKEKPPPLSIKDLVSRLTSEDLRALPITFDNHCFGCTAGAGSSCQGAL
jgi:hypothetical protein